MTGRTIRASTQDELVTAAAAYPTATLHEAGGRIGALPARLRPVSPGMRVAGRALPVSSPAGDNLWLHRAIYRAAPGSVLVVEFTGAADPGEYGHWGEIMAVAAQQRGIAGLVADGGVRDVDRLVALDFPTFAAGVSIRGTDKDPAGPGSIGRPVRIGEVTVSPKDIVVGDADGVVVLPAARAGAIVAAGAGREARESELLVDLRGGLTTLEAFRLPGEERE